MSKISIDLQPFSKHRGRSIKIRKMTTAEAKVPLEAAMLAFEDWGVLARNLELIKISWEDESYSADPLLWLNFLIIVKEPDSTEKIEVKIDFRYPKRHDRFSRFEMYWEGFKQFVSIDPNLEYDPIILAGYLKQAVLSKIKIRVGEINNRGSKLEKLVGVDLEVTV